MNTTALARRSLVAIAAATSLFAACVQASPFAYVPNASNLLSVIDTATNSVVATFPTGANPIGVSVSPAGNRVYVTNFDDGTVSVYDSFNNRVLPTIAVGAQPVGIAVSPDGRKVAVATFGGGTARTISVIDVGSSLVSTIAVGRAPIALAYNPSGSRLFVASQDGTLSTIDTASSAVIGTIGVPANAEVLAINPAGTRVYVGHARDANGAVSTLSVIDVSAAQLVTTTPLSSDPQAITVSPDGSRAYIALGSSGTVGVLDTSSNKVVFEIVLGAKAFPTGVAESSDSTKLYVVDAVRSELATYDLGSLQQIATVSAGSSPAAVGNFLGPFILKNGANSPGPLSGIWYNPGEPGWGLNFTQRGSNVFAAWYSYDSFGNPKWYVAPNCAMPTAGSCSGTLYQVTGPRFFGVAFDPSQRNVVAVGSVSVNFATNDTGTFTYTVGTINRTVSIQREPIATGPALQVDYTDLWFNASEPGWGIALTQQASVIFAAWYVYDDFGNPVWYVVPNCAVDSTDTSCDGDVFKTKGPPLGTSFDPTQVNVLPAGHMFFNFTDPNNGQLNYLSDSLFVTKKITRELF
jgi:YVTN family beta-propeller protein